MPNLNQVRLGRQKNWPSSL